MRISWRQVSALLVLLALIASACSSDPTDVVSGDDDAADESVVDDADLGEIDAALEESSADATSSVADDSAPSTVIANAPEKIEANAAAREQWIAAGIDDYDVTMMLLTNDEREAMEIEVRGGEVTRSLGVESGESGSSSLDMVSFFDEIEDALRGEDDDILEFDVFYSADMFGLPSQIDAVIIDDREEAVVDLTVSNLRTPDVYPEQCSTKGLAVVDTVSEVTVDVGSTRAAILTALSECDFLMLSHLAALGSEPLTTSFGGSGIELLWEAEAGGEPLMTTLYELLTQDHGDKGGVAVWPAEFAAEDSEYPDWRVGIAEDGEWLFFVAGD